MKSSKLKAQSSRKAPGRNGQASKGHLPGASVWKDLGSPSPLLLHENSPPSPAPHSWDLVERVSVFGERLVRFSEEDSARPDQQPFDRSTGRRRHERRCQLLRSQ